MKRFLLWMVALAALAAGPLCAQDVTGAWQGTVHAGNKDVRLILKISKEGAHLEGTLYSIDQGAPPIKASSVTQDGANVKFAVEMFGINYEGKLSADGKSVVGAWTQGGNSQPMTLVLPAKDAAWEIPAPPPPPKMMAAGADPSFEVATIKPNDSGTPHMKGLTVNGRDFKIVNGSLLDMMQFAFNVQTKQIVNAPDWAEKDRYDVAAVPDQEGTPSGQQLRVMLRKMLAERFGLKEHEEKRELSAFVLRVTKEGSKLQETTMKGPLPGLFFSPAKGGASIHVMNASMEDLCGFLQSAVLDRPVVDATGLKARYDFSVTFLPDDSEFGGRSPFAKPADDVEAAPSLYDAMPQQLGLKLSAEKKPSAN
jgi:uncharacterized protein (TIGR03435 family)